MVQMAGRRGRTMFRRKTFTIDLIRYVQGAKDRHGNSSKTYADPVPLPVWVVAPRNRDEPRTQDRAGAISTVWDIYAPKGTPVSFQDRVKLHTGELCEVVGEVGVWENNPHSVIPAREGIQFTVQKWSG